MARDTGNSVDTASVDRERHMPSARKRVVLLHRRDLVAARAGIVAASAQYIKGYAARATMAQLNVDLIVRAAARIERMCKIRYGSVEFKASG